MAFSICITVVKNSITLSANLPQCNNFQILIFIGRHEEFHNYSIYQLITDITQSYSIMNHCT